MPIENYFQLSITKTWIGKLRDELEVLRKEGPGANIHPTLHQAMIDSLVFMIGDLEQQVDEYIKSLLP